MTVADDMLRIQALESSIHLVRLLKDESDACTGRYLREWLWNAAIAHEMREADRYARTSRWAPLGRLVEARARMYRGLYLEGE